MDRAIKHHFNKDIKEKIKLPEGWKETWLLVLSDNQKVVFRSSNGDYTHMFEREKFFYENVNKKLGRICPEIYVIDGTCEYYEKTYQISEYIEGKSLSACFREDFDQQTKNEIYYRMGEITAKINQLEIDPNHQYITSRKSWEDYFANKLYVKLNWIIKNGFITTEEIDKICENMRSKKAIHTLSFTHNDIRIQNMIYNNGDIFVIDAEECEFGDPLHELAFFNFIWPMNNNFLNGYKSVFNINLDSELYNYYLLDNLSLIIEMHWNRGCMADWSQSLLNKFNEVKEIILHP